MSNDKRKVYVVGHKNPDTDSICTAIAYANLKTKLTQIRHEPRRAGQLNEETQYVLERWSESAVTFIGLKRADQRCGSKGKRRD